MIERKECMTSELQEELKLDAAYAREVSDTEEAQRLQNAILDAINAYFDYLNAKSVLTKEEGEAGFEDKPWKCDALVAEMTVADYGSCEIRLVGGAIDRLGHQPRGKLKRH
jgi:hypothetical protein